MFIEGIIWAGLYRSRIREWRRKSDSWRHVAARVFPSQMLRWSLESSSLVGNSTCVRRLYQYIFFKYFRLSWWLRVKNLPSMQDTWVQSLGWEDLLEEGMATHSSVLGWRTPMDRGAWCTFKEKHWGKNFGIVFFLKFYVYIFSTCKYIILIF